MGINPTYASYGLQIVQGIAGYLIGSIQANLAAKLQEYQNQIMKVMESMNANRVTMNEIASFDATVRLDWAIQQQSVSDMGANEVAAAAAGTRGRNVDSRESSFMRSAANAQGARKTRLSDEMRNHLAERRDNALRTISQMGIQTFPGPSILSAGIGVAANVLSTYQDSNPVVPKSIVQTPSGSLGLAGPTSGTLIDPDAGDFWQWNTGPNG